MLLLLQESSAVGLLHKLGSGFNDVTSTGVAEGSGGLMPCGLRLCRALPEVSRDSSSGFIEPADKKKITWLGTLKRRSDVGLTF